MAECKVDSCTTKISMRSTFCTKHQQDFVKWQKRHRLDLSHLGFTEKITEEQRIFKETVENPNYIREYTEKKEQEKKRLSLASDVVVTTGDIAADYDIIGPVYFSLNNSGIFSNQYTRLVSEYTEKIQQLTRDGLRSQPHKMDWGFLYGELSFGLGNYFDNAFYMSTEEIKKKTAILGGDAIIFLRQDIDLDTNHFQKFYLQMYGTAVKCHNSHGKSQFNVFSDSSSPSDNSPSATTTAPPTEGGKRCSYSTSKGIRCQNWFDGEGPYCDDHSEGPQDDIF